MKKLMLVLTMGALTVVAAVSVANLWADETNGTPMACGMHAQGEHAGHAGMAGMAGMTGMGGCCAHAPATTEAPAHATGGGCH